MTRFMLLTIAGYLLSSVAWAEPYWIAYEGNDLPENEGWQHATSDPPADRWVDGGNLFVDTRVYEDTIDGYTRHPELGYALAQGETFVMRWSLLSIDTMPWEDPGVALRTDDGYAVIFAHGKDYVTSTYEFQHMAAYEPDVFHEFEMRSDDLRHYELSIDGIFAFAGAFSETSYPSTVGFGHVSSGYSLTRWDYFRFGVVPEPASYLLFAVSILLGRTAR